MFVEPCPKCGRQPKIMNGMIIAMNVVGMEMITS